MSTEELDAEKIRLLTMKVLRLFDQENVDTEIAWSACLNMVRMFENLNPDITIECKSYFGG